ncbi:BTB/POZ domain-containing protein KCTD18-like [Mytilus edulis]|uniref:BTB/POZ domain-containing protein KCTD18-like n=1 Tax=Mytilus edulis TaxID=6550 RepID=UPI0039F07234
MDKKNEQNGLPSVINLNVGGYFFTTRLSTLRKYEDSMLAAMFSERYTLDKDKDENFFLDMDGSRFKHILNYLRNEQHLPPRNIAQEVLEDATYLGINTLVDHIRSLDHDWEDVRNSVPYYSEMKEKIIKLGETVDAHSEVPPSWKFHPHVILDFIIDDGLKINQDLYQKSRKILRQGNIEINCPTYADAVTLAGCLYKDILNDGYNVKIEELFPCSGQVCNDRPVSEISSTISADDNVEEYTNFRFMLIFDWKKFLSSDL